MTIYGWALIVGSVLVAIVKDQESDEAPGGGTVIIAAEPHVRRDGEHPDPGLAGREVPAALPPVGSRGHEEWRLVKVRRWRIAEPSQGIRAAKAAEDHQLSNIRYYF